MQNSSKEHSWAILRGNNTLLFLEVNFIPKLYYVLGLWKFQHSPESSYIWLLLWHSSSSEEALFSNEDILFLWVTHLLFPADT